DVVAAQLSEGDPRTLYMKLTRPYRRTAPVLLHHVPKDPDGRSGYADTVRMAWRSPFGGRAAALGRAINGSVLVTDSDQTEQDLFVDVALGRLDQAIVSEARAGCLGGQFPHLRVTEPLARSAALVFGVRSNARKLLGSLNAWLRDAENAEPITEIVAAYSGRPYAGKLVRSPRPALHGAGISPFDSTFRKHAAMMSFDWRLLAAVAFGESGFDPTAVSHKGAFGLMQMMPGTAGRLGLDSLDLIDQQVKGAAMYLAILDSMWMRRIPDQEERLNFVLASYNAGPGHVLDAVRLAPGLGLDPGRWEEHVERAMLLLALPEFYLLPEVELGPARGSDTFLYVRQVRHVFRYYLTLEPIEQGADTLARS
ncbi:MAG: transglycosylase SLT domain-containing protein, partial [Flavobacteriales bacterium]|nr:transglycosylase SLT domain-containing protein [Flavobacteriales bacterium]